MVYQRKWYVVIFGTEPGVYPSWIEAGPKTKNIPGGAIFQSFLSEEEAYRVFEAAKARGEVKAYPDAGEKVKFSGKSKSKNAPLSPLGEEAALLRTPSELDSETERKLTASQRSLSSSAYSRVAKLRRQLRDPVVSHLTPSPPTEVTQVYAPLYEEDDTQVFCDKSPVARRSPHFTSTSSSSRAYPVVPDGYLLGSDINGRPLQLEVSDWSSPPRTPSFSNSHPGAEKRTPVASRCMPRRPESPFKSKGVKYRTLADLDTESVDSRVWLPESRVFNPDKVKPRPLTRPSSPAKKDTSVSCYKPVGDTPSPQSLREILLANSSFVSVGRGRRSKLTPSLSLPILPKRELECDSPGSPPAKPPEICRTGTEKDIDFSVQDAVLGERATASTYSPSPRSVGRSHVQLVPRDGEDDQGTIAVLCPPNCLHETCYCCQSAQSVPALIESSTLATSRYVDACVSPIVAITSCTQDRDTDSPTKPRSTRHLPVDGGHPCELAGLTHISHKGIAPEADVRSPFVRGTMIPVNTAEMGRIRWKNTSRLWRSAHLTRVLALFDLTCLLVALAVTVLTHVFWAL